jgi:uncharacterized protein
MAVVRESLPDADAQPNSPPAIRVRIAAGRISWPGPLLLASARTILWIASQAILALVFLAVRHPHPWHEAGNWWVVYGNLTDICCLLGIRHFLRREGIRIRDLIGPVKMRWGHDLFYGLGLIVAAIPLLALGSYLARVWLFGAAEPEKIAPYLMQRHAPPLWATLYSLVVWWIVQSATEEITYQGYVLPRLEALTGQSWVAVLVVAFWWGVQHCAVPFVFEWRYIAYRSVAFLPLLLVFMVLYLRTRRLAPFILAHWPLDFSVALMTAAFR